MKCLLIMTLIFIKGIENAEIKSRHSGTILREDDLDSETKAWLLMLESDRADEERPRKITPKSIFIAPLLTSRSTKCKEGYRYDHLGQCVKVIKLDQKAQLDRLLKRLNAMYAEKKAEEGLQQISNGPLHFSIPISGDSTTKDGVQEESDSKDENTSTVAPVDTQTQFNEPEETETIEYSGSGPVNDTLLEEGSGMEGSGEDITDLNRDSTTESATLISEELDFTEAQELTTTESTLTEVPYTTESQETATYFERPENRVSQKTIFPVEEEEQDEGRKVTEKVPDSSSRIVFPDSVELASNLNRDSRPSYPVWPNIDDTMQNNQYNLRTLPPQQLWWLPSNWRVKEEQRKPAVFKFWSHLPLVHDPSFVGGGRENLRRTYVQHDHEIYQSFPTRAPDSFTVESHTSSHRRGRGRGYGTSRVSTDYIQPVSFHRVR